MRIPLRERFGLLILPLIAIQFLCFLAIVVPSLTIPADLRRLELHLRQRTLTASLARLFDVQAKACVDFVLSRDDADRRRIEDLQGRARNALARWQALKSPGDAAEEIRSSSEVERDSGRINQLIQEILDRVSAGGTDPALERIRQELAPLLARLEGEEDRLIQMESIASLESLAGANGRLGVANLATWGKLLADLDATRSKALRAFVADQFARRLSRELFLYALTAAIGRREPGIEAVRESAGDALDTWRKLVENQKSSNQTRETAAFAGIDRGYSRIAETGVQLLALVGDGRQAEAVEVLTRKLDPIAETQIAPLVDQVVATDAAEVEVGLATISNRLRWVFGVLGAVSLLGLALGFSLGADRVRGRFDRVDEDLLCATIIDYKTGEVAKQTIADRRTAESLQLQMYALAWREMAGTLPQRAELRFIESNLVGRHAPDESDVVKATEAVKAAASGIRARRFEATPSHSACRFCAYNQICPFTATRE